MKKLTFLSILVFFSIVLTSYDSCEDSYVKVTATPDKVEATPGEEVTFAFSFTPVNDGEIDHFYVSIDYGQEIELAKDAKEYKYTMPEGSEGMIDFVFKTVDIHEGKIYSTSVYIDRIAPAQTTPEMVTVTGKTVNYSAYTTTTELGWSIGSDGVVISESNDDDLDIVFLYDLDFQRQLYSPEANYIGVTAESAEWSYSTSTKKLTKIDKVTESDWTNATAETLNNLSVAGNLIQSTGIGYNNVAVNDVYAFELADGRKGLMKVISSTVEEYELMGDMTLDFKFQATAASK